MWGASQFGGKGGKWGGGELGGNQVGVGAKWGRGGNEVGGGGP